MQEYPENEFSRQKDYRVRQTYRVSPVSDMGICPRTVLVIPIGVGAVPQSYTFHVEGS
jgi:hypothetical protein